MTEYQRKFEELPQLYYKPRENLYEPHTQNEIKLGTREVKSYYFPELLYNKILYVEKEGLFDVLKAAQIPEKYDMAIISGEGYSTTATRNLLLRANKHTNYKIFVLHDADPAGYDIARTLKEETERMPEYSIDLIDLGLKLEEAIEMGLTLEDFSRKEALPKDLVLNEVEKKYFDGEPENEKYNDRKNRYVTTSWACKRIEISVLKPEDLIKYVERKLQEHGATSKIIPEEKIKANLKSTFDSHATNSINAKIDNIFSLSNLKRDIYDKVSKEEGFKNFEPDIIPVIEELQDNTVAHWRDFTHVPAMDETINKLLETIDFKEEVIKFVTEKLSKL